MINNEFLIVQAIFQGTEDTVQYFRPCRSTSDHSVLLKDSYYKEVNYYEQNNFEEKLPKLVPFAHVQTYGLTETAGTDYS